MGIGLRFFIIDDSDNIFKIPITRYERLHMEDSKECLPQFKNSKVRYALVSLNTRNRKPISIWRIEYRFLHFDNEGKLDASILEEEMIEGLSLLEALEPMPKPENIIDAKGIFLPKKLKNTRTWNPSEEMRKKIYDKIFGN